MAITKTIQATVKNRTDTAANWTQKNPVLAEGEIIVVQTSVGETRLKIGDGVKTFTQLPYIDEQIYNNVVTSVNGETGDITMNSVEYTSQTLTDAQKKQARDNIDAAIADFVVNGTLNDDYTITLDKTFAQIREAIGDGKIPIAAIAGAYFQLSQNTDRFITFSLAIGDKSGSAIQTIYVYPDKGPQVDFYGLLTTDSNGALPQVNMAAAPTEDMQIATKKYVDDHVSADVYVDFWPTGTEAEYNGNLNGYQIELATDQTFDAIFDSIKAGNKIVARLYKNADKSDLSASSVDTAVTGSKEFGGIHFQFVTADTDAVAGFPFIGEGIMMLKIETSTAIFLVANHNVLPTPNADGTDNGKVPIINGIQWELKKPPAGSPDAVLYTPQTLTDAQKKQARQNVDAAANDFVITATLAGNDNCTTDKTYTQIQEAVQAGKKVVVKIRAYGFDFVLPLIGKFESDYMFTAVFNPANTVAMQFAVVIGEQSSGIFKCRIPTYNSDGNSLQQVTMEANPTEDMEIATKKYVDDKISDKELILSSSTAGSIKKFKLTIDDTGTLTASEITA